MAYWLVKSEPSSWSWGDQVKKGVEHWNGVRNHQADNNMKAMKKGDKVFFTIQSMKNRSSALPRLHANTTRTQAMSPAASEWLT
jgi:predicted RNA-binding protein with PUA-like domain